MKLISIDNEINMLGEVSINKLEEGRSVFYDKYAYYKIHSRVSTKMKNGNYGLP